MVESGSLRAAQLHQMLRLVVQGLVRVVERRVEGRLEVVVCDWRVSEKKFVKIVIQN